MFLYVQGVQTIAVADELGIVLHLGFFRTGHEYLFEVKEIRQKGRKSVRSTKGGLVE
jgi:hypothetical protein